MDRVAFSAAAAARCDQIGLTLGQMKANAQYKWWA
jgi:hypothetical protein